MSLFAQMKLPPPDPFQTSGIPHSVQIYSAKRARLYLQKGSDQILKGHGAGIVHAACRATTHEKAVDSPLIKGAGLQSPEVFTHRVPPNAYLPELCIEQQRR